MLYLKLMSNQNESDSCPSKNFVLVPISDTTEVAFRTDRISNGDLCPDSTLVFAVLRDKSTDSTREISLTGNAYVLNEQGKTIASHASY